MRNSITFFLITTLVLCAAAAGCTLITEVDRGLIGAGGMGGATP